MPKKTNAGSPADWLDFARSDLDAVKLLSEQKVAFRVCRSKLAEALEKRLKADLISKGWMLEKTHDLQRLADCLDRYDRSRVEEMQGVIDDLAEAYTQSRYPGFDFEDSENWDELEGFSRSVESYLIVVYSALNNEVPPAAMEDHP